LDAVQFGPLSQSSSSMAAVPASMLADVARRTGRRGGAWSTRRPGRASV